MEGILKLEIQDFKEHCNRNGQVKVFFVFDQAYFQQYMAMP